MPTIHLSSTSVQARCNAFVDQYDNGTANGYMEIYANDGDGMPADANTAITNQTLLGTVVFAKPAFSTADSSGSSFAASITGEDSAVASGTAAWARHYDGDDTVLCDTDVGDLTSSAVVKLSTTAITAGDAITITTFTWAELDGTE